jgi:hypothetical protein
VVNIRVNLITCRTVIIIIIMPYETRQEEKQHKTLKAMTMPMYRSLTWTSTRR